MAEQTLFASSSSTDTSLKTCRVCGNEYPLDGFHKDKRSRDGHTSRCKRCATSAAKAWYYQNIDDPEFRERRKACGYVADKKWREANPDYVKQRMAEYRRDNADAIREQDRRYWQANRDRKVEKDNRRRARLLGAFVAPVKVTEIWGTRCRNLPDLRCGD